MFGDAVSDPALREILSARLQDPYRLAFQDALDEPENRVLFLTDATVATLLHRTGTTADPLTGDTDDPREQEAPCRAPNHCPAPSACCCSPGSSTGSGPSRCPSSPR
ncbi:hypothetical protein ACFVVX_33140 [Kitasatospora sp. NPDC058170]|uniref:hypothetical protein n=1 Tax=Kitasatospora sp. NPDC058170 TaxID=3346364 RepID=UPI0036DE429B